MSRALSPTETVAVMSRTEKRRAAGERPGQALFNALYEVRPDLAAEIQGTTVDPFYDDERWSALWDWLAA